MVLVDPVHEEGVGDFEFDDLGAIFAGTMGLNHVSKAWWLSIRLLTEEHLLPESGDFLRLHLLDGHFNGPC